ncbi:glycoside hydrolase family 15 protein [Prolixibacter denitrificans]|uniref:GH15 family glucan-1,4-alpha-glucosidase n=1 Tax=Prolixibacter denitrificans TaxID=1541063 RepID=A0A2P8CFK7_9BACT|nr:glycoside hydrolase family 15 protein [Prolixibacter denitrificans]PSK83767.1 GH15 family glucan-1,4-alpha-glucosidase [Prolixibacter denitrificans]GET23310.1 glucoamylase [Prolixibacter denitrificans]
MSTTKNYSPIEDYGLIGNLNTTALVSKQGSIDFMPFSRFDSPTVFGALLDKEKGGFFSIEVKDGEVNHKQLYLPDTAVLLTRYHTKDGIAELTDFMPLAEEEKRLVLVRKLKIIKGKHTFRIEINPQFNYGKNGFTAENENGVLVVKSKGEERSAFQLHSELNFNIENNLIWAEVELESKDELNIALVADEESDNRAKTKSLEYYAEKSFEKTVRFWRNWINKSTYSGRWQDVVNRSAITLKLLSSGKYGSTVAAATFGLPELIGGERNWDYRFTWIRDAAFTMYSFLQLGYTEEARRFISWIQQRSLEIESASDLKLMYRVDGSTDLREIQLKHLEGYKKSAPVRIGNGAFSQFQLDIYGELVDTIYIYNKNAEPISYEFWKSLMKFIDFVGENWKEKDRGIWEVRDDKREFLISKVMSWVALDRGILIAEDRSFPAPLERWRKTRNEIFNDVFNNFWSEKRKAFVQYRGGDTLDASALLIPLVRMLSPKEPRWISTLRAIEEELVTDSLVYRYKLEDGGSDGFSGEEGTFSMCSFWYIECLAKSGEMDKAILYFEKMLGYANHVGLYSEQISLKGELLGNFPQAFTHLGLISAAHQLRMLMAQNNMLKGTGRIN